MSHKRNFSHYVPDLFSEFLILCPLGSGIKGGNQEAIFSFSEQSMPLKILILAQTSC